MSGKQIKLGCHLASLTCLVAMLFVGGVVANNYDDYLTLMALRNEDAHRAFRDEYASGDYVLDYVLRSPEFRETHPILRDYDSSKEYDDTDNDEAWDRLMSSLTFASNTARSHYPESASRNFQSLEAPWANQGRRSNSTYPQPRKHIHQSGLDQASGEPSEMENWMKYAIYGAQAQEMNDEEEERPGLPEVAELVQTGSFRSSLVEKLNHYPAYCDPPNPCPVGYDPATLPSPCDRDIPDTKEFNRNWIMQKMASGECSCDEEHMEVCPASSHGRDSELKYLQKLQQGSANKKGTNPYLVGQKRSDLRAKKYFKLVTRRKHEDAVTVSTIKFCDFWPKENPFLGGSRLRNVVKKAGRQSA